MYHGSTKDFWATNLTARKRRAGCGTAVMYHGSIKDFWATKLTAKQEKREEREEVRKIEVLL